MARLVSLLATGLAGALVTVAAAAGTAALGAGSASASSSDGFSQTRTITREFADAAGVRTTVDRREFTLNVDHTSDLQGRERVHVSWSGAHPSGGRSSNPYGISGLNQEYPVVIMQCRGIDDSSLPEDKRLSPQSCWTSSSLQRSITTSASEAVWTRDLYADPADAQQKSGATPFPGQECDAAASDQYAHITPFVDDKGKSYTGCTDATMPPEASTGSSFPPAEQEAFTGKDGTGSTEFEVRSSVENASLGCSPDVPCSLVVVPIEGLSCAATPPTGAEQVDDNCRRTGTFDAGSSNFEGNGVDQAVSPLFWWSASNWRNRISVPLTFGLPPGACDILDQRAPTAFYGSELLTQAALQWAPAYCLRQDRFKWQDNVMPDDAAFALMQTGGAAAAEVSAARDTDPSTPVEYAPTAVTGFAVSYVIDKPGNTGEFSDLRLNARLLAKLLTESYPASSRGAQRPGIQGNPWAITADPEFQRLNPGLSTSASEAAATVMSLSISSDVIGTLTSYIAHDKDASAFVAGQADPWGMKVNPAYQGYHLPVTTWELKDTYVPPSKLACYQQNPAPYLPQVAAPVGTMRQIAGALLDGWPLVQTQCTRATPSDPWKLGRVDREGVGSRFILGLTTLGDAARYGLHTAALEAAPGAYVAPTGPALAAAVALATPAPAVRATKKSKAVRPVGQPFTLDQAAIARSSSAYPGTMIVYTAARTSGADPGDAAKVASFIRTSTTEGQQPGRGNGQLPEGYLPITDAGATQALYAQAQRVADDVAAQRPVPVAAVKASGGSGGGSAGGASGGSAGAPLGASAARAGAPGSGPVAGAAAAGAPKGATAVTAPASSPLRTQGVGGGFAGGLLPTILVLGLVGGLAAVAGRFGVTRWLAR